MFFEYINPEVTEAPETRFCDSVTPLRQAMAGWGFWMAFLTAIVGIVKLWQS